MTRQEFSAFLNDCPEGTNQEEMLKTIIEEEMAKSEDEMDTDLIEFCLDALQKDTTDTPKEVKQKKFNKILLVAAIAAVLLCGTFTVSATVFENNWFEGILKVFDNGISIDFKEIENADENYNKDRLKLKYELSENIIGWTRLPKVIYNGQIDYNSIIYDNTVTKITATVPFILDEKENKMVIEHYADGNYIPEVTFENAENPETFRVNDITVFLFKQNINYIVAYRHNLSIYTFTLDCNYDEAMSFAKSVEDEFESLDTVHTDDAVDGFSLPFAN